METNYSGGVLAISSIVVIVIAKLDPALNIKAEDIATIIFGVIGLVGAVKQMWDHRNAVASANAQLSAAYKSSDSQ